jgi:hypothetical protein
MLGDGFYGGRIFFKGAGRPEAVHLSEKNLDLFAFIIEMRPDPQQVRLVLPALSVVELDSFGL